MRCRKWLVVVMLISMGLMFACTQQIAQQTRLPAAEDTLSPDYRIGPEDVVEIIVWKNPDLSRVVTVRPDGKLSLPLIGDVDAAGLTPPELATVITERLKVYYQEPPEVAAIVQQVNSYAIYIIGEVSGQGRYVVKTGTTLLQAIALAGGFSQYTARDRIVVRRTTNNGDEVSFRIRYRDIISGQERDIILQPGDIIIVY